MSAVAARLRRLPPAVVGVVVLAVVGGALALAWGPLSRQAVRTAGVLRSSDPRMLALAVALAAAAVVCTGLAWVVAARSLGSSATFGAGLARYAAACLAPPKLGNPSRILLLARTLPVSRAVWTMTGVCGGISLLRILPLAALIVAAAVRGSLSPWPAFALVLAVLSLLAAAPLVYRRLRSERLQQLVAGFALLTRSRITGAICLGWLTLATLAKVLAVTAAAAALGLRDPFAEGLVLVPALAFGRTLPFFGFAAGAIAVGAGGGVGVGSAISLVLAVSAVEGVGAICCGLVAVSRFASRAHLRNWRTAVRTALSLFRERRPASDFAPGLSLAGERARPRRSRYP